MKIKLIATTLWIMVAASCGSGASHEPIYIERFDSIEMIYTSLPDSEWVAVLSRYTPQIDFLQTLYGVSSADSAMAQASESEAVNVFGPDIKKRITDLSAVEERLGQLKASLKEVLPTVEIPARISGIILPYRQSIVTADSLMLVSLNHYMGPDYEGYAIFDPYTRRQKNLDLLPYHVAEAIVTSAYPYQYSENATVLSRLLYEGAVIETLRRLFEDADVAVLMGYDSAQMQSLMQNESTLWQRVVDRGMLYDVDRMTAAKLIDPANATSIVSSDAPPRAGRFLGWKIVNSYTRSHPEVSVAELLLPDFYLSDSALKEANYSPGN